MGSQASTSSVRIPIEVVCRVFGWLSLVVGVFPLAAMFLAADGLPGMTLYSVLPYSAACIAAWALWMAIAEGLDYLRSIASLLDRRREVETATASQEAPASSILRASGHKPAAPHDTDHVPCPYCGKPISLTGLLPGNMRCPACRGDIVLE